MPFDIEADPTELRVRVRSHGIGTLAGVLEGADRVEAELRRLPGARVLVNNVRYEYRATPAELRAISDRVAALRPLLTGRLIDVVRPGLQYGLARMFGGASAPRTWKSTFLFRRRGRGRVHALSGRR